MKPEASRAFDWRAWLPGLVVLTGVVIASLHFSEAREFVRVAKRARPACFVVAIGLQALTYAAQGEVFRTVAAAGCFKLGRSTAYRLSLIKLFLDQAFPSAGLSGTAVAARELKRYGMPRALIASGVVTSIASYQFGYAAAVLASMPIMIAHDRASAAVLAVGVGFALLVLSWSAIVLVLAGRRAPLPDALAHLRPVHALLEFLRGADVRLTRDVHLLARATAWQLVIIALDASTMWVLLFSLAASAAPDVVFASFMLSSILRSIGLVPGGLGTFEAMSVLTLKLAGVPVPVGLAATLMFRGLSFWLPMFVGLALYRWHAACRSTRASQQAES